MYFAKNSEGKVQIRNDDKISNTDLDWTSIDQFIGLKDSKGNYLKENKYEHGLPQIVRYRKRIQL
jgi:hypothetical protein